MQNYYYVFNEVIFNNFLNIFLIICCKRQVLMYFRSYRIFIKLFFYNNTIIFFKGSVRCLLLRHS